GLPGLAFEQSHHQHVEQWHEEHHQYGRGDHAPDDAGGNRVLTALAGAGGQCHRQYAEGEGQGGHQDGAQTQARGFDGGLHQAAALVLIQVLGELDDQDGVLGGKPDRGHQADLEVDVGGQAAEQGGGYGSDDPQRHHHDDGDRNRPALVQGGETEEHDDDGQGIQQRRLIAGLDLLIGQAGIGQTDARRQFLHDFINGHHGVAGTVA